MQTSSLSVIKTFQPEPLLTQVADFTPDGSSMLIFGALSRGKVLSNVEVPPTSVPFLNVLVVIGLKLFGIIFWARSLTMLPPVTEVMVVVVPCWPETVTVPL